MNNKTNKHKQHINGYSIQSFYIVFVSECVCMCYAQHLEKGAIQQLAATIKYINAKKVKWRRLQRKNESERERETETEQSDRERNRMNPLKYFECHNLNAID